MDKEVNIEEMTTVMPRVLRTAGRLHMVGASALIEEFGEDGEFMLRQWLRRFGYWRGKEMRKAHMALGLEVNMENLIKYWDSASSYHLKEQWETEAFYSPYNVRNPLMKEGGGCPMSEPWIENDFWQWGHVLCDELHIQIARGYHPDAAVVIPECIMKKEERCDFNWLMPPNSREPEEVKSYPGQDVLRDWEYSSEKEKAFKCLLRSMRVAAARIYFLWEVLSEYRSEEAESKFADIMKLWAINRADALRKEKGENNWGDRPENLFLNLDYPYGLVWDINNIKVKSSGVEIEISYCPFAETWGWLGGLPAMRHHCENCYSGIASHYDPALTVEVPQSKTRGDDICRIRIMDKAL